VYYIDLAIRSLKSHKTLTVLMVLMLGLGIGACITTLTVLRLLSGDPLPQKSATLFYPQVDPFPRDQPFSRSGKMPWLMSYTDAMNLLRDRRGDAQAAMAMTEVKLTPATPEQRPFFGDGVMATADFFRMFDAPFRYGAGWSASDEEGRAQVVVIADYLNQKLFGGMNSVGRSIRVNDHDFRIVGVLGHWAPQPRFYAMHLGGRSYGEGDAVFIPLQSARAVGIEPKNVFTYGPDDGAPLETAPAIWLGVWVQTSDPEAYRSYLSRYASAQAKQGRFEQPRTALSGLMAWMRSQEVVPDDVRLQAGLAFGFLVICVVNTVGLLLAKCLRRSGEIGVRRALGATRREIFVQFLVEAGIVGLAGGLAGLLFTEAGLWLIRRQPADYAGLAHMDAEMFVFTFVVAVVASLVAGLLPAWRACILSPAPQLKRA
jgi:putative ABC transport system permease protein